jgi:hypothetical protein
MRVLDLFCGRWGWSRAFAARGWDCIGIDLVAMPGRPQGCIFFQSDILTWTKYELVEEFRPDFIVASPPCEEFSVWGMRHFHKNPPHPTMGIKLFNHTRALCEMAEIPHVVENVRAAQKFVGEATGHAGSFYLWGDAVPPILPKVTKGFRHKEMFAHARTSRPWASATIPAELANAIAAYAENSLIKPEETPSPTEAVAEEAASVEVGRENAGR